MNDSALINNLPVDTGRTPPPLIAVVGKPNVGKSTLFNKLIGKRKAITDALPGVTRDPIEEAYYCNDKCFRLVDTGGIQAEGEEMDNLVTDRSLDVIKKADLIIFMLDVTNYTAGDELLVDTLRPFSEKVVLVVNKVDNPKRETDVWEFYALGFQPIFAVSAAHGMGFGELEEYIEGFFPDDIPRQVYEEDKNANADKTAEEKTGQIKVAVLGKPNTGKSTLVNHLTGSETSIVSPVPGTTRDVVEGIFLHRGTQFTLLDTAGIRKKGKIHDQVEYYSVNRAIRSIDEADVVVLMVAGLDNVTDQDKKIAYQVVKRGKGIVVALSKWDLLEQAKNLTQAMQDRVHFLFPVLSFAPIVPLSTVSGEGIDLLLSSVYKVNQQLERRVETSTLNEHIGAWVRRNEPPRTKRSRYKIFYGIQTKTKPVEFLFFVNHKKRFPEFYQLYLKNCIRRELGFSSVPITLLFKER